MILCAIKTLYTQNKEVEDTYVLFIYWHGRSIKMFRRAQMILSKP